MQQKEKKPWSTLKIIMVVLVAIFILRIITTDFDAPRGPSCNCEYKDELGTKKRMRVAFYRDCKDLIGGDWLGDAADCEVK